MDAESHRVLQFRCAETGRRFIVVFTRQHPASRFKVTNVVDEREVSEQEPDSRSPTRLLEGSVQRMLVPVSAVVAEASRLFQRFLPSAPNPRAVDRTNPSPLAGSHSSGSGTRQSPPPPPRQAPEDYDPAEFDFSGWYCPCCGHGKATPARHQFIRCGRCHEYICGARVHDLADGRVAFACHDRCGNRGFLSGGAMKSLAGMGFDTQKSSLLENRSSVLPGKTGGTSAGRALSSGKKKDD
ncbi:MAG TPA: hypothetical protein VMT24_08075 [Aggregatilineaceae bacterium]|nr:hypothetical protein [Aggregatilineaceae bacterium]